MTGQHIDGDYNVVSLRSALFCISNWHCLKFQVKIFRESITLSPVFTAVLPHMTPDGHLVKTGYVRLTAFSQVLLLL